MDHLPRERVLSILTGRLAVPPTPRRLVVLCAALWSAISCCGGASAAEKPEIVAARLGLANCYRVGRWAPLQVEVAGGEEPLAVQVLAATPDAEGFGVGFTAEGGRPLSSEPGRVTSQTIYVYPGTNTPVVEVNLLGEGGRVARRVFSTGGSDEEIKAGEALELGAAIQENVVLQLGGDAGAAQALTAGERAAWRTANAAPIVNRLEDLPSSALGYDAFDTIVLLAGSRAAAALDGWLGDLTPDDPRIVALREWVEQGGRLVLSCGSDGGAVIGPGGALESFLPAEYEGPDSVTVATAIEGYADAPDDVGSIELGGETITISGLRSARGVVEAYAGRSSDESPLIIRNPMGFGEVTFVAFDLDAPAVSGWKGRPYLVRRLLRAPTPAPEGENNYGYWGREEIADRLLTTLEKSFRGVRTAPFIAIVGLVVLYLLLIGPGDYFFVKNVLGRMEATWITFPLIVAGTSAAAYYGAYLLKGDKLKVNQVEVIDVDTLTGRTRGLLVTDLFSPRADRYTLALSARGVDNEPITIESTSTAWTTVSASGFGPGTRAATGVRPDYQLTQNPRIEIQGATLPLAFRTPNVVGLPIQVWSTKALVSRYYGRSEQTIVTNLARTSDALVTGSITNEVGVDLYDCRLLYGDWAWKLGLLNAGETAEIGETDLVRIKTFLASARTAQASGSVDNEVAGAARLLSIGSKLGQDPEASNEILARSDLAPHLDAGRALLLVRVDGGPRSELVRVDAGTNESRPIVAPEDADQDRSSWVFVNFLLPVPENAAD